MRTTLLRTQLRCHLAALLVVAGCLATLTLYSRPAFFDLHVDDLKTAGYPPLLLRTEYRLRDPIFAGTLIQRKYLSTAGRIIQNTWGSEKEINSFNIFVGGEGDISRESLDLPITTLRTVPEFPSYDSSLLQTFEILKHLHFHYADRYNWFLLTYKDTYISSRELLNLVNRMNPDSLVYFGKVEREYETGESDYFCSGHAGIILSNRALGAVVPYLDQCLHSIARLKFEPLNGGRYFYTERGDAGLGYCMKHALGVTCSTSEEVR